ncbi:MAG: ribosomal protein L11 methyltransferase [Epulopiscium sp. Nuni2H_MBin003]|nr:MAG: ribosomal protein L11 methyltransferase [Epulopiscium sp. Nuni2H_MBin003]
MDYIEISIETTTEAVEAISYYIIDELNGGVEICDPKDVLHQDKTQVWYDFIDETLLNVDMDIVVVKGYFENNIDTHEYIKKIKSQLEHISQFLNVGSCKISASDIPEEKWAHEWKKYYKVFTIGKKVVIKPSWLDYTPKDNDIVIEIDPAMAFGTGTHETTSMCVCLIEKYISNDDNILDVGTGSGILGIVSAKLGAKCVIGIDIDDMAVKVAQDNIKINNVDNIMKAVQGDLLDVVDKKADIVVTNIIADIIILLAAQVKNVIAEDGIWISSGIINTKKDKVLDAIKNNGWIIQEIIEENEWIAIVAKLGENDA